MKPLRGPTCEFRVAIRVFLLGSLLLSGCQSKRTPPGKAYSTVLPGRGTSLSLEEAAVVADYGFSSGLAASMLSLRGDGTFDWNSGACLGGSEVRGYWERNGDRITVTYAEVCVGQDPATFEWQPSSGGASLTIVTWGPRTYLIEHGKAFSFMSDVLSGSIQKSSAGSSHLCRNGTESLPVQGEPNVPESWKKR